MSHGHNTEFLKDPVGYLSKIVVMTVGSDYGSLDPNQCCSSMYLDLLSIDSGMKSGRKVVRANFSTGPLGDSPINGAFVPYASEGDVKSGRFALPALELPLTGSPKFVFTGAMNGCSLVLATKSGKRYAIHYPNSAGATLRYPLLTDAGYTYVKSLDYYKMDKDKPFYGTKIDGDREAPGGGWYNTFAFFYYDGSKWVIVGQPQIAKLEGTAFTGQINGDVIVI